MAIITTMQQCRHCCRYLGDNTITSVIARVQIQVANVQICQYQPNKNMNSKAFWSQYQPNENMNSKAFWSSLVDLICPSHHEVLYTEIWYSKEIGILFTSCLLLHFFSQQPKNTIKTIFKTSKIL